MVTVPGLTVNPSCVAGTGATKLFDASVKVASIVCAPASQAKGTLNCGSQVIVAGSALSTVTATGTVITALWAPLSNENVICVPAGSVAPASGCTLAANTTSCP